MSVSAKIGASLHRDAGPSILATCRDTAVSVLHRAGIQMVAAHLRYYSQHPAEVLPLIGLEAPQNA